MATSNKPHYAIARLKAGQKSHSIGYSNSEQVQINARATMSSPPVSRRGTAASVTVTGILPPNKSGGTLRKCRQRQTLAAIFPDTKEGRKALDALKSAADDLRYDLEVILFEKMDFGDTKALDKFYSASVAVADVTDRSRQANLFYQLGLRESFDMRQNIVTYVDEEHQSGRNIKTTEDQHDVSTCIMHIILELVFNKPVVINKPTCR